MNLSVSTSASVSDRPRANIELVKMPSIPAGVIKCCKLGVSLNGTASELDRRELEEEMAVNNWISLK